MDSVTKQLSRIYKANQCIDINDVITAIEQCSELNKRVGFSPAITKRMISLTHKAHKLNAK